MEKREMICRGTEEQRAISLNNERVDPWQCTDKQSQSIRKELMRANLRQKRKS